MLPGGMDIKLTPGGSVLVSTTFGAVAGPLFVTAIVYVNVFPMMIGFGESIRPMTRSAVAVLTVMAIEAVLSAGLASVSLAAAMTVLVTVRPRSFVGMRTPREA